MKPLTSIPEPGSPADHAARGIAKLAGVDFDDVTGIQVEGLPDHGGFRITVSRSPVVRTFTAADLGELLGPMIEPTT